MLVLFELSMPGNNAWNGRWSGEGKCYAVVRSFRSGAPKFGYYDYNFGDGWRAGVTVREITSPAAKKLRKQSIGFCGYDWMIDDICKHGRILTLAERTKPGAEQ